MFQKILHITARSLRPTGRPSIRDLCNERRSTPRSSSGNPELATSLVFLCIATGWTRYLWLPHVSISPKSLDPAPSHMQIRRLLPCVFEPLVRASLLKSSSCPTSIGPPSLTSPHVIHTFLQQPNKPNTTTMSDADLEQIRQARLQQLQQQGGARGSSGGGEGSEQDQRRYIASIHSTLRVTDFYTDSKNVRSDRQLPDTKPSRRLDATGFLFAPSTTLVTQLTLPSRPAPTHPFSDPDPGRR